MSCDNLEAAKQLVKTYRAITLDDLVKVWDTDINAAIVMYRITGFGYTKSCSLCTSVATTCSYCIHYNNTPGFPCINQSTYHNIKNSKGAVELLDAIKARADYIESLIEKFENDN